MLKPSSRKVEGSIAIRLERNPSTSVLQELVNEELSQLEQGNHINHPPSTDARDDNPMEALCALLGHMKPLIHALGAASTVRAPCQHF